MVGREHEWHRDGVKTGRNEVQDTTEDKLDDR